MPIADQLRHIYPAALDGCNAGAQSAKPGSVRIATQPPWTACLSTSTHQPCKTPPTPAETANPSATAATHRSPAGPPPAGPSCPPSPGPTGAGTASCPASRTPAGRCCCGAPTGAGLPGAGGPPSGCCSRPRRGHCRPSVGWERATPLMERLQQQAGAQGLARHGSLDCGAWVHGCDTTAMLLKAVPWAQLLNRGVGVGTEGVGVLIASRS